MLLLWPQLCQCPDLIFSVWVCCSHHPQFYFPLVHFLPDSNSLLHPGKVPLLSSFIIVFLLVMLPHYIQPPFISAHNNPLGFYIQKSVHISRMIICISNKHACFPSVVQLGSHLFPFMYGNYCHFSKRSQMLHVLHILIVKQCEWWFCSVWSHHYIIQICCCGNDLTPKFSFFLSIDACLYQQSPCSSN